MMQQLDFDDVQGLARFGFGSMRQACFYLVCIKDLAAARAWLLATHVTTARTLDPPPSTALQIGFTVEGLEKLGVPREVIDGFSPEFLLGMAVRAAWATLDQMIQAFGVGVDPIAYRTWRS
jgi:hypothetical protein